MIALQQGTTDTFFKRSLAKQAPENMNVVQERARKYIKSEESLRNETSQVVKGNNNKRRNDPKYDVGNKYVKNERPEESASKKKKGPRFTEYARVNTTTSQILMDIENDKDIKWPKSL